MEEAVDRETTHAQQRENQEEMKEKSARIQTLGYILPFWIRAFF